jgi:hypothetical protein
MALRRAAGRRTRVVVSREDAARSCFVDGDLIGKASGSRPLAWAVPWTRCLPPRGPLRRPFHDRGWSEDGVPRQRSRSTSDQPRERLARRYEYPRALGQPFGSRCVTTTAGRARRRGDCAGGPVHGCSGPICMAAEALRTAALGGRPSRSGPVTELAETHAAFARAYVRSPSLFSKADHGVAAATTARAARKGRAMLIPTAAQTTPSRP